MPLVIDCYNVLHADPRHALTTASLCARLAQTRWARYGVTVVCDGLPKPTEQFEPPPQVQMIHSGPGKSADDVIIATINAEPNPRRLVVVSSDNVIRAAARRRRANSWTSDEFLRRLAEETRDNPAGAVEDKPVHLQLTDEQVDAWLRAFGFEDDVETDDEDEAWPPK